MTSESRKNLFAVDWPDCLEGRLASRQQSLHWASVLMRLSSGTLFLSAAFVK
jgi:hypothetical protein